MIKSSIIALVTVAALAGAAAPAFADNSNSGSSTGAFGSSGAEQRSFAADNILTRLQQNGVKATSVEEWGHLVRAFVTNPDGSQSMEFFAPVTLKPVTL